MLSGAINGESALTIRATERAADSRYAKIMEVMRESESSRPQLRRLGDRWARSTRRWRWPSRCSPGLVSGEPIRFLAVLVIATPCPLLIAIPIAIIGSISLCARRAIIVKSPVVLEQIAACRTAIFDKTGTLTYGEPTLTEQLIAAGLRARRRADARGESGALLEASAGPRDPRGGDGGAGSSFRRPRRSASRPAQGLRGDRRRPSGADHQPRQADRRSESPGVDQLPAVAGGLECVVAIDDRYAAALRFRDAPRAESRSFVQHLGPKHQFQRVMIVSGDRESEVRYLAEQVGITEIHAQQSPGREARHRPRRRPPPRRRSTWATASTTPRP